MGRLVPISHDDQFLMLAVWRTNSEKATRCRGRSWEVSLALLAILKSRIIKMEKIPLTVPGRIERLIGLLPQATACPAGSGGAGRHGPPTRKVARGGTGFRTFGPCLSCNTASSPSARTSKAHIFCHVLKSSTSFVAAKKLAAGTGFRS